MLVFESFCHSQCAISARVIAQSLSSGASRVRTRLLRIFFPLEHLASSSPCGHLPLLPFFAFASVYQCSAAFPPYHKHGLPLIANKMFALT